MSYCRFSDDDHQCDVFVYESAEGFVTHVAARRTTGIGDRPRSIGDWWNRGQSGIDDAMQRSKDVEAWLESAECKDIGLPHDGESFVDGSALDCANRLKELKNLGYLVPDWAIEMLLQESGDG